MAAFPGLAMFSMIDPWPGGRVAAFLPGQPMGSQDPLRAWPLRGATPCEIWLPKLHPLDARRKLVPAGPGLTCGWSLGEQLCAKPGYQGPTLFAPQPAGRWRWSSGNQGAGGNGPLGTNFERHLVPS